MAEVTTNQAKSIVEHYRGASVRIAAVEPFVVGGFDAFIHTRTYSIRLDDDTSFLIKTSPQISSTATTYSPNTLATEQALLSAIVSQTDIPTPTVHTLDTSNTIVPYSYLLLAHPRGIPLSVARASGKLSERQLTLLDLRTGIYLKTIHERVQNDWFGMPSQANDGLYTWQEAFTPLVEGLLEAAHGAGVALPYADLRVCMSRAIGFFLFDDCEVPSLVFFTADESSILVDVDIGPEAKLNPDVEILVTAFMSVGHALWGDPLLETLFMDPRAAFVEGYGGPLVLFARQRTKRLWYTLFLALVVLVQADRLGSGKVDEEKLRWARESAVKCAAALKDAPCY